MAKRIALLMALVMVFSLSFVFATEGNQDTPSDNLAVSGEANDVVLPEISGEATVSGEAIDGVDDETISGEVSGEENPAENDVSGEVNVPEDDVNSTPNEINKDDSTTEEDTESGSSSTVVGAVIAIVVVIAVVAIVAVLQRK